jgi:hypothetical protein
MNRVFAVIFLTVLIAGCGKHDKNKRVEVAAVGSSVLYLDQIPRLSAPGMPKTDSAATVQNYINKWIRRGLLLKKANENLAQGQMEEIDRQLEETRSNLVIYEYERQLMLEKMDTIVKDSEIESYYNSNPGSFTLNSNIVKALYIKLPLEVPNLDKIKRLARSNSQQDLQELETLCYQFAEKFDDFQEKWVPFDRISVELPSETGSEETLLKRSPYFETTDSANIYIVNFRDYRLRLSVAPIDYVKEDIRRILWNRRRIEFLQNLENGIYNDGLKQNNFKIF